MISVIPLRFLPGYKWAQIRELCGKDEQSVAGTRSVDAICLMDRILQGSNGNVQVVSASATLPVPDRDRLLTAVYFNTYGSKIETTISCPSCNERFDLSFSLDEWVNDLATVSSQKLSGKDDAYPFLAPGGIKFRLPTGEDEMVVMGKEPATAATELLNRCIHGGSGPYDTDLIQKTMHEIAPLADAEFEAQCPECSEKQLLHFNLQQYLLSSLLNEQKKLVIEVHRLASAYGWGLNEIMELPRSIRRTYITMLESG
jgi:hypothetical protein